MIVSSEDITVDVELTFEIMIHHDCNAQERCDMCDKYTERDSALVFS